MESTTVFLVRHAQSAPNREQPEPEWPLSAEGRRQAQALVPVLEGFGVTRLFSSPYPRAIDTVRPFATRHGLQTGIVDDLRERKLMEGWSEDWLQALAHCWREPDHAHPGGESNHACQRRVVRAVEQLVAAHRGQTLALASHGNALALFLASIDSGFGMPQWQAMKNPDLFRVEYGTRGASWDGRSLWP